MGVKNSIIALAGVDAVLGALAAKAGGVEVRNVTIDPAAMAACLQDLTGLVFTVLNAAVPANCIVNGLRSLSQIINAGASAAGGGSASRAVYNTGQMWVSVINTIGSCAGILVPPPIRIAIAAIQVGFQLFKTIDDCSRALKPCDQATFNGTGQQARDPNDKTGPAGIGSQRWIGTTEPLSYAVAFENVPTATAPAAEVSLTDQLDVATMDPSTVAFGPLGWGGVLLTPPPGSTSFSETVDLRPAQELLVRVSGSVDAAGLIRWTFTSIDPATGLVPADPSIGFLPPDISPPAGQGLALFTVAPRSVPVGGSIANGASIVFDVNAPIGTPVWSNRVAPCTTEADCRTVLGSSLPPTAGARGKTRKVARKLTALRAKLERAYGKLDFQPVRGRRFKIEKVLKKDARARAKVRKLLTKLDTTARTAEGSGQLGVPFASIEGAVGVLDGLLPS